MVNRWGCDWPYKGPFRDEKQCKFRMRVAVIGAIMFQLCIFARKFCSFVLGENDSSLQLLKTRPSYMFMLLGWKKISTISRRQRRYQDLVWCSQMHCSLLKLSAATADLNSCPEQSCWSFTLVLNRLTMLARSAVGTQCFQAFIQNFPYVLSSMHGPSHSQAHCTSPHH